MTAPHASSPLRLIAVGDVGRRAAYHVGDEAMLLGLIETSKQSGLDVAWSVMSMDPPRTAAELGVRAVPRLTFEDCAGSAERDSRLAALEQIIANAPHAWAASAPVEWRETLSAIADCDGVVIAGGGNLNRAWPSEVFERAAVANAARRAGRPVAITGQTIGPSFDERTRELTSALLKDAAFIGLREASSRELALELGAPRDRTRLQFDDAIGIVEAEPSWWRDIGGGGVPYIAVTLNQFESSGTRPDDVGSFARQLVEVSRQTGAAIVLVPHVGHLDGPAVQDVAIAQALADAIGGSVPLHVAPLPAPEHAVWIAAHAEIVISTRYHPVVFAIAGTTPSLFLHQDHYTFIKGSGALQLAGLQSWTQPVADGVAGLLTPAALELWARRHEIRAHLQHVTPAIEARRRQHVSDLVSAVASPEKSFEGDTLRSFSGPVARGEWAAKAQDAAAAFSTSARLRSMDQQLRAAEERLRALTTEVDRKHADLIVAQAALAELTKTTNDAHVEWLTERESLRQQSAALERRASIAEQWAGTLAREVERKEADLKTAIAAIAGPSHQRAPERSGPLDACTIVARNYLPYARVFAESLAAFHPGCRVTVLVVDGPSEPSDRCRFRTLQLEDVIPDEEERRRQTFMYDVTELSTAVKPLLLRRLLAEGAASVLYFDPDVEFFGPVDRLWQLAERHQIVLTPHVLSPIPEDGYEISDLTVLRAGLFNLGFIGVGAGSDAFLDWWIGRLRRHCVSDPGNGLFVDQRWLDYVPAFFPHVVEKDAGCNVAYWNLHERQLEQTADGFTVDGAPLRFYHFSGFNPDVPHLLSKHQGSNPRVLLSEQPAAQELCRRYAAKLRAHGCGAVPAEYGFSMLPDGTPIDGVMRRLFRRALLHAERTAAPLPPSPFGWERMRDWLNSPAPEAPRLSRYLFGLHQLRPDLQRTFPAPFGAEADAYLHWVSYDPVAVRTIPASLRPPFSTPASNGNGDAPPARREGLNVAGYFKAELGVGEVARLVTAAARMEGLPVATVLNDRTLSRQEDAFEESVDVGPYPVTLVCANADEFPRAVDALPSGMRDGCHRIGFWFWETERLPQAYRSSADLLDEIWVASEYVADAVRTTVTKPVRICPVPVRQFTPAPRSRAALGVPDGFLFLFMFDFLSNVHRKNPVGLVNAFCRAFRPGEGPTLVLKSINGGLARSAREAVLAAIDGRPDVIAMDGYMASVDRDALMNTCDCYVSLHRSEGYGLTMAEAMTLGKPTIATAYSGNLAFMTPENSFLVPSRRSPVPAGCAPYVEGDWWSDPDLDAAASLMRLVWENPELADDRGQRGRRDVLERCSSARTIAFIRERLCQIHREREQVTAVSVVEPPLPSPIPDEAPPPAPDVAAAPTETPDQAKDAIDLDVLRQQLELAAREVGEADAMLASGIPFGTPSRFGWPGQLLRTAVMRLLRPYEHFQLRAQRQHLQSTQRVIECLQNGMSSRSIDDGQAGDDAVSISGEAPPPATRTPASSR